MSLDRVASTANILAHWVQASEDIEELRAIITLLERSFRWSAQ